MAYEEIDETVDFAIDAAAKASVMQQLNLNMKYLKALMAIATGHTHDQGGTDEGGPVQPADGSVTPAKLAPSVGTYSSAVWELNTERSYTAGSRNAWFLFKSQKVYTPGKYRVRFEAKKSSDDTCQAQIYINGVATGPVKTLTGSYVTHVDDYALNVSDHVELYMMIGTGSGGPDIVYCRNFAGFLMFMESVTITDANP